ncbi:MAG: SGNH/GDSL hydrolase family protein, partial [Oscillospiraceae bacterium]|nr:SGNH/GDSL hydrolase family protein [Oscillospiraceae bacterium]
MKRFLSMMLASCMVLSIAGCSQKTDNSSSADTSSSAASDVSTDTSSVASDTSATDTSSAPAEEIEVEEVPYVLGGELTPTMKVNSVLNKGNQARLAKVIKKLQAGEEVTVAYLGGS